MTRREIKSTVFVLLLGLQAPFLLDFIESFRPHLVLYFVEKGILNLAHGILLSNVVKILLGHLPCHACRVIFTQDHNGHLGILLCIQVVVQ